MTIIYIPMLTELSNSIIGQVNSNITNALQYMYQNSKFKEREPQKKEKNWENGNVLLK